MPKVSVLMPVYNAEKYLKETIESILNQTYNDFEFLIIDDASTDSSVEIIKSFNDKRIIFSQNEKNLGISETRNLLMKAAKGEYLAIADNDDISLPARFEKQVEFLDKNPKVGVVGSWVEFFPKQEYVRIRPYVNILHLLHSCGVLHPSSMLRKSYFDKLHLTYNKDYFPCEDFKLWSQAIKHMEFFNIQEVLLMYRSHNNNSSKIYSLEMNKKTEKIRKEILDFLISDEKIQKKLVKLTKPKRGESQYIRRFRNFFKNNIKFW